MARKRRNKSPLGTLERLKLFRARTTELNNLRLVQSRTQTGFTIAGDVKTGVVTSTVKEPDEEDLRSFLLLFRHFISDNEPVFVNRIFDDCFRFLNDDRLKGELKKAREEWRNQLSTGNIAIRIDDTKLTPEHVLDLWINGYYFHNDPDKLAELKNLLGQPLPFARGRFVTMLPILTTIILFLGEVVSRGLDNNLFQIPEE